MRTSADVPLRRRLRQLGVDWIVESSVAEWHGDAATLFYHTTGATTRVAADWLAADLRQAGHCLGHDR